MVFLEQGIFVIKIKGNKYVKWIKPEDFVLLVVIG